MKTINVSFELPEILANEFEALLRGHINPCILVDTDAASDALLTLLFKYRLDGSKDEQAARLLASSQTENRFPNIEGTQLWKDMKAAEELGMSLEDYCDIQNYKETELRKQAQREISKRIID